MVLEVLGNSWLYLEVLVCDNFLKVKNKRSEFAVALLCLYKFAIELLLKERPLYLYLREHFFNVKNWRMIVLELVSTVVTEQLLIFIGAFWGPFADISHYTLIAAAESLDEIRIAQILRLDL